MKDLTPLNPFIPMVLSTVHGESTKARYAAKLAAFFAWWDAAGRPLFNRNTVQQYIAAMDGKPAHAILHALTPLKKLAKEMHYAGLVDAQTLMGINDIQAPRVTGTREGQRLTEEQVRRVIERVKNPRDIVAIGLMLHCGLRRAEAAAVTVEHVQVLDGQPVLRNLIGKGGKMRTVRMPAWLFDACYRWMEIGGVRNGPLLGIGVDTLRNIAMKYAGVQCHDLRRTVGALARAKGVPLETIRDMYGHASVVTTERYIGRDMNIGIAAGDVLPGLETL